MANSSQSRLEISQHLPLNEHAELARQLIAANDLYRISNSSEYNSDERAQAFSESEALTQKVLVELPDDISALNLAARIELDKKQLNKAKCHLEKALKLSPQHVASLLNLAYVEVEAQEYEHADKLFKAVLEQQANNVKAFSGIALVKLKTQDYLGAFVHYRKLLEFGYDTEQVRNALIEAMSYLAVDYYQPDIEDLLVNAFSWADQDIKKLANIAGSTIKHKYDLNNPQASLDMNALTRDALLLETIKHCVVPDPAFEELVVAIRQSILSELMITKNLRDDLLPMVIAIGHYSAKNDYIMMMDHQEEQSIIQHNNQIKLALNSDWSIHDVVGALMIVAMYEPLYTQSYSYKLLGKDLEEWPAALQDLFDAALYQLALEHQYQFQLYGNTSESILNNEVRRCADRWSRVPNFNQANLYNALKKAMPDTDIPKRFATDTLNVLVVGAGSGKRAAYLAAGFSNVNVIGVDSDPLNVSYARMMADQLALPNLSFLQSDINVPICHDTQFDIIEVGSAINYATNPQVVIELWKGLLVDDGLIRLSLNTIENQQCLSIVSDLVKSRNLSATTDNIRHLRHAIFQEANSGLWEPLLKDEQFYSGAGCKELLFHTSQHCFDLNSIAKLLERSALEFIDFVDLPKAKREQVSPFAPTGLNAWRALDQDGSLFEHAYQLYARKSAL